MFKVRLLSSTSDVAGCDDILKTYLLACELKNTKLSILGLVGMEKLIAHDAVLPSALPSVLATLKELKTLQTALTILQSQLHPTDEMVLQQIDCNPQFYKRRAHFLPLSIMYERQWNRCIRGLCAFSYVFLAPYDCKALSLYALFSNYSFHLCRIKCP
ncbi:hypothetical protein CY35_15G044800 [Sphagnum magellanicum]|nr:hypothetical protein CY35_15G044800 [Sphagnum magellanicum]KAH9539181.1 hypothetical protein CY35_15G044800 [Sphagnum magellanicum]